MKPTWNRAAAVAAAFVATVALVLAPAASAQDDAGGSGAADVGRVLIVSIPRLTWDEVADEDLPNLDRFLAESAVGDLSLRSIGPRTSLGEGYLTMGSGNRAGVRDADSGRMLGANDPFENGTAGDAYTRRTGWPASGSLVQLSIAAIQAANDRFLYGAKPGALGTALRDNLDRGPFVIGNSDVELSTTGQVTFDPDAPTGEPGDGPLSELPVINPSSSPVTATLEPLNGAYRPAGLAVMDRRGQVAAGSVSHRLLERNPEAPFGVQMSSEEVLNRFDRLWEDATVGLVELSDLERADLYRSRASRSQADDLVTGALQRSDDLLGQLLDRTTPEDLVIVVSPAAPRSGETLTPIAIRGGEFESGILESGTTRRAGYVTLPDIAPTVLAYVGIDKPDSMTGAPIAASNDGSHSPDRYEAFIELNEATAFRDAVVMTFTIVFVVLQVVLGGLAIAALARGSAPLRRAALHLGLVTMCIPVVTFLLGIGRLDRLGFVTYFVLVFGLATLLALGSRAIGRRARPERRAVLTTMIPVALTYAVLAVDIVAGGSLQLNTIFGYSPLVAGRFAGYGNPAYALLSISTVILSGALWAYVGGDRPGTRRARLLGGIVALWALTIVLDGHPSLGSDVGGILSIIPTGFVVVWLLLGRRIRIRTLLVAAGATLVGIALFAALDLSRPETEQTHLGRLVRSTFGDDGGASLLTVIERKVNANLTVLTHSIWTWTIPLALVVLILVGWRRPRALRATLPETPANRAVLWGGITMCVLGMAVNDSGISVPAVMFMLLLPYLLYQALSPEDGEASSTDDAEPAPASGAEGDQELVPAGAEP